MRREPERDIERSGQQAPYGFWAGPILWGLQLLAGYGLATVSCNAHSNLAVLLIVGISGAIVVAAAFLAYSAWRQLPGHERSIWMETDKGDRTSTFLAVSAFVVSLLFLLLILATFVTDVFLSPCPIITMPLP